MTIKTVRLCGPCGNVFCYQNGCVKEKAQALGPMRVTDVAFCLQVLADQPLSTEDEHIRIDAKDHVENLKQQIAEMGRIDDAISRARKILRRPS